METLTLSSRHNGEGSSVNGLEDEGDLDGTQMCSTERSENRRRGRPDIYLQSPNGLSRQSLGKIVKVQGILNYTVVRKRFTSWITSYILLMSQTERFFLMKQMLQKTEITHLKIRDDVNGDLNRKSTNSKSFQLIPRSGRLLKNY